MRSEINDWLLFLLSFCGTMLVCGALLFWILSSLLALLNGN